MQLPVLLLLLFISGSFNDKKESKPAAGLEQGSPTYDTSRYAIVPFDQKEGMAF